MKIPKTITVYGKKYKIKRMKNMKDEKGNDLLGLHESDKALISIDSELKGEQLIKVFMHELGHAVQDRVGVDQCEISSDLQEIIVESMATFLSETFHFRLK